MEHIKIKGLCKSYEKKGKKIEVLKGIALEISGGGRNRGGTGWKG